MAEIAWEVSESSLEMSLVVGVDKWMDGVCLRDMMDREMGVKLVEEGIYGIVSESKSINRIIVLAWV